MRFQILWINSLNTHCVQAQCITTVCKRQGGKLRRPWKSSCSNSLFTRVEVSPVLQMMPLDRCCLWLSRIWTKGKGTIVLLCSGSGTALWRPDEEYTKSPSQTYSHIFFFNAFSISLLAKFANFESDDLDNSHFKTAFKEVFLLNWKLCINGHDFSEKVLNWSLMYSSLFWIYFNFINYMWMVMQDSVFALEKTFPTHTLILLFAVHHSPM